MIDQITLNQVPNKEVKPVARCCLIRNLPNEQPQILFLLKSGQKNPGAYELPGGGPGPKDQDIIDTIIREIKEETGYLIPIKEIRPQPKFGYKFTIEGKEKIYYRHVFPFVAEIPSNQIDQSPILGDESIDHHNGYEWITIEDLQNKNHHVVKKLAISAEAMTGNIINTVAEIRQQKAEEIKNLIKIMEVQIKAPDDN